MALLTTRNSQDPLVRALLESHKFNLLSVPRENSDVYDLYIGKGRKILPPGRLQSLFTSDLVLPEPRRGEEFKAPEQTFSASLTTEVVAKLVDKLFEALGISLPEGKVGAVLKSSGASACRIRFDDVVRDSVDPIKVHNAISKKSIGKHSTELVSGREIYLVVGVVRAKGIEINSTTEHKTTVNANLDIDAISQGTSVTTERKSNGNLIFKGGKHIAFGVELVELKLRRPENILRMGNLPGPLDVLDAQDVERAFIGDADGCIFVDIPTASDMFEVSGVAQTL